jgi:hypothetical protein
MKRILTSTCIAATCGLILGILIGFFTIGLAVFYYWFIFGVMYGVIPGAIIGAVVGGIRAWRRSSARSIASAGVNAPNLRRRLAIVLITITLCALIVTPLFFIGQTKLVTHKMRWQVTNELFPTCKPAVVLIYVNYPEYQTFCSAKLQQYLEARGTPTVSMTFSVTYDFGRVRGYRPIAIGDYPIEQELGTWGPGATGCGGDFLPACSSATDTNASPWR